MMQFLLGFGLALVLNQRFFGRKVVRVIFLMPMMTTPVAVAYAGRMMFDSRTSPTGAIIAPVDADRYAEPHPMADRWTLGARVDRADGRWQWIPFMTLILLAGMQAIPDDIYEAARVDGASSVQIFCASITFPILLPLSVTVILIRGLEIFKIIDMIVVTTGGGPGSATESLTMYIYKTALTFGNYGYAAAISFVLLVW